MHCILYASLGALVACGNGAPPVPPPSVNPALGAVAPAKCAPLADSVLANTPRASLSLSVPNSRPESPRVPRGVREGVVLHTTFLVRPDGAADTASVEFTGTTDAAYRREIVQTLVRMQFTTPALGGCPVWGRGDFQQVGPSR